MKEKPKEIKELIEIIERFDVLLRGRLPYLRNQFTESIDKTIVEAKGEVESFIQHKVNSLGLKVLKNETQGMIEK